MKSLGIFGFAIIVMLILVAFVFLVKKLNQKYKVLDKVAKLIRKKLFYNGFLRYMVTGNLKMTHTGFSIIAAWIYLSDPFEMKILVGIAICLLMLAWPIYVAVWMEKHSEELHEEEIQEKFGTMYQGTRIDERMTRWYIVFFSVRRLLLVLFVVFSPQYLFIRVQSFLFC